MIRTDRRERGDAAQACHLNDVSRTLRAHDWQRRLYDPQRPKKVRFELGAHIIFRQFLDHAEVAITGVIDNDIELAEVISGSLYRVEGSAPVGDIELERQDGVAVPLDERVQGPQVASRCGNSVSPFQSRFRP